MRKRGNIEARLRAIEAIVPDGWKSRPANTGDALDRWIDQQIGDPEHNAGETATEAGNVLVYAGLDALATVGTVTGEPRRAPDNPSEWPIASRAADLAVRDLARELRAGREATPPCYSPDGYEGERFDLDALAGLLKRAGFKQPWSPWEVWADRPSVLDTLKALGIPRDWKST